jgi:hypothetical protein
MARQELPPPDVDDWFSEPDVGRRAGAAGAGDGSGDDWLAAGETRTARRRATGWAGRFSRRQLIIGGGAIALVLLLIGLAVGGVFSSGSSEPPAVTFPPTTQPATVPSTQTTPPSTPTTTAPAATLKPGDTGPKVRALQRALTAAGYPTGKVDGDYGPATTKAVQDLQKASGLTADGVFGPKTREALVQALGKSG